MARAGKNHKGGRPKGKKSQQTLEKEAVLKAYKQRVMTYADILLDAQLTLAKGQTYLYKIEKIKVIGPKGGVRYEPKKPELVTSKIEIEAYLEGLFKEGDLENDRDPGATYYYITTKDPDGAAINAMLDRTFGRPVQAVVTKDPEGKDVPITAISVVPVESDS